MSDNPSPDTQVSSSDNASNAASSSTTTSTSPSDFSEPSASSAPAASTETDTDNIPALFTSTSSSLTASIPSSTLTTTNASPSPSSGATGTPQTLQPTASNHLSDGAIAGVAIGCAALGALLALILMILLRRRQSKSPSKHHKTHSRLAHKSLRSDKDPDKSLVRSNIAPVAAQPDVNVDAFLPQQTDDATVKQRVLLLFDQIELHVDNYYSEQPVQLTADEQNELSRFGTPELPMPLGALLETSHRKVTVIKHCLAYHAVQLVTPSHSSDCILPYEVSNMLLLATPKPNDRNFHLALSRWRMLTAYLRPDIFDGKELPESATAATADQDAHLYTLAQAFSDRFAAFSQPHNAEQKVKHLAEVLRTAVRMALWLYAQPATFRFDWGPGPAPPPDTAAARRATTPTVVTVPSLVKTHDGMGREIQPAQIIQLLVKRRV
ncbi:hypothetical protein FOPE_09613 [Fonsecaea pedrosoi]|nr:hypothetical protein FOPE_09613 [Fonsecaea pedrosoi]